MEKNITRLEYFAAHALQGVLANASIYNEIKPAQFPNLITLALEMAIGLDEAFRKRQRSYGHSSTPPDVL